MNKVNNRKIKNNPLNFLKLVPLIFEGKRGKNNLEVSIKKFTPVLLFLNILLNKYFIIY